MSKNIKKLAKRLAKRAIEGDLKNFTKQEGGNTVITVEAGNKKVFRSIIGGFTGDVASELNVAAVAGGRVELKITDSHIIANVKCQKDSKTYSLSY